MCVLLNINAPVFAQEKPSPLFRGGIEVVAVDVTVVDDNGAPVKDLSVDDFILKVEDEPRHIVSAEYMSHLPTPEAELLGPPPSHFSSNEDLGPGRLIMLVVDQGNIHRGNGRAAMKAGKEFLDSLTRGDRVGLAVIPAPGENIPFTTDHEAVKEALDHVVGARSPNIGRYVMGISEAVAVERNDFITWDRAVARECSAEAGSFGVDGSCSEFMELEARSRLQANRQRVAHSLSQLQALMRGLGRIDGPKTLVYISEGLLLDFDLHQMSWLPEVAAMSHITLYAIHLNRSFLESINARMTSVLMEDSFLERQGLETLAGFARGAVFSTSGTPYGPFRRIARELSGDYLLSFEPDVSDREAGPHSISVQVKRTGVTVRARPEFRADSPTRTSTASTAEELLSEILRSPFPVTELPIRTTSYTILDQASSLLKLIVVCEIGSNVSEPEELAVQTVLLNSTGRMVGSAFTRVTAVPLNPWRPSRLQYTMAFLVEPGRYLLRFAVVDNEGRRGSVDHQIDAKLTHAQNLRLSDLMLAEVSDDPHGAFKPRIDMDTETETIATYLELYPDDPSLLIDADISVEILPSQEEEPALIFDQPANLRDTDDSHRFTVDTIIPVSLLAPGGYIARVIIRITGEDIGYVERPFRIVAQDPTRLITNIEQIKFLADPEFDILISTLDLASVLENSVVEGFLESISALQETPPTSPTLIAMEHASRGRFDEILVNDSPKEDSLISAFLKGLVYLNRNELSQAARQFRVITLESAESYPALFYLGVCYAAGGRERDAVGAWHTTLIADTQFPIVYQVLADSLIRLKDAKQATVVLEEALEIWPENAQLTWRLAWAQARTGQKIEAFKMLVRHLDQQPDDIESLLLALRLLYESHEQELTLTTPEVDREHLYRYAETYHAANGRQGQLVQEWVNLISATHQ